MDLYFVEVSSILRQKQQDKLLEFFASRGIHLKFDLQRAKENDIDYFVSPEKDITLTWYTAFKDLLSDESIRFQAMAGIYIYIYLYISA